MSVGTRNTSHEVFRDPIEPHHEFSELHHVEIRHPAYDIGNVLLYLPAVDRDRNGTQGVHLDTVRVACGILANNNFHGHFTRSRSPTDDEVDLGDVDVLPVGTYYYHVSRDSTEPWPIVPTFQDWRFPHGQARTLPLWSSANARAGLRTWSMPTRKRVCLLTGTRLPRENAHIIPRDQRDWFDREEMWRYCNRENVDGPHNSLDMRVDLHKAWDTGMFAIVPKHEPGPARVAWRVQALIDNCDLIGEHHNRATYIGYSQGTAMLLLARFAWQVIRDANDSTKFVGTRTVIRQQEAVPMRRRDIPELQSRSGSRRKRKNPSRDDGGEVAAQDLEDADTRGSSTSDSGLGSLKEVITLHSLKTIEEEETRGRKRRRNWDEPVEYRDGSDISCY